MKSIIKSTILAAGALVLFTACDENSWNDKLDGFEVPQPGPGAETLTYTLTDADYTKIATKKPYITDADDETKAQLLAIGNDFAFATEAEALKYVPMFLRDSTNNFYALANGSAIKVTYNVLANMPAEVQNIRRNTSTYDVTQADYQKAWGSDEDFIDAYAPDAPASRAIPSLLRTNFPDAVSGDYVVVNYNEATENPIFGTVGGGDTPAVELTDVLGDIALEDQIEVTGVVTAIDNRGFVLTDNGGSILCYQAKDYDINTVSVGNVVSISGEVSAYGTGFQLDLAVSDYNVMGTTEYTYPTPREYTVAMIEQAVKRSDNATAEYVTFTGKASVGSYINFILSDESQAQGSGYQVPDAVKATLVDGATMKVTGYFVSVSSGRYFNVVITSAEVVSAAATAKSVASVPTSTAKAAIYEFNGSSWSTPANTVVLQPADYTAMGQSYGNLSGTLPEELLPIYLKNNYPYAAIDDEITVAYKYYASGSTVISAKAYKFDGSSWTELKGATTSQFVRQNGFWLYNPSVIINLPYARNTDPSYTYYMGNVQWVYDNISVPMGATSMAEAPFIDYRGNAEFYSGASAYYGNVDIRATAAKNNAPEGYTGYDGMTDEEITFTLQKRFCTETMPGALSIIHPDARPIDGMDVTYTINFVAYTGAAEDVTVVYKVSGPGQFQYVSCTWFTNGEDADWTDAAE